MTDIMLSIHPQHAEAILDGRKTLEIRKTKPTRLNCHEYIYLYATAPVRAVVGVCEFKGARDWCAEAPDNAATIRKIAERAAITAFEVADYWATAPTDEHGHKWLWTWKLDSPHKFAIPESLDKYGIKRPPQSFCYVKEVI